MSIGDIVYLNSGSRPMRIIGLFHAFGVDSVIVQADDVIFCFPQACVRPTNSAEWEQVQELERIYSL